MEQQYAMECDNPECGEWAGLAEIDDRCPKCGVTLEPQDLELDDEGSDE